MTRPRWALSALFSAILLMCTVLGAELSIRFVAMLSRRVDCFTRECSSVLIDPKTLAVTGSPVWPDHDSHGFRNPHGLTQADIVTLGDSHTYETSVQADRAWPARLAGRLHLLVYDMALPATGPLQSLELLNEARALHAKSILFGFYFGNDLADSFEAGRRRKRLAEFADGEVLARVDSAEHQLGLVTRISRLAPSGPRNAGAPRGTAPPKSLASQLKLYLSTHTRLYRFLGSVKGRVLAPPHAPPTLEARYEDAVAAVTAARKAELTPFSDGQWKTILTSSYRLATLDQSDVRVQLGMRIAQREIQAMRDTAAAAGARFVVVLLPTKETVFHDRIHDAASYTDYASLVEAEAEAKRQLVDFFRANHIDFIDPIAALRASSAQPYFENVDGHPNEVGHAIIASEVAAHLSGLP